jgi:hypothetical protein
VVFPSARCSAVLSLGRALGAGVLIGGGCVLGLDARDVQSGPSQPAPCFIAGTISAGTTPLPGVEISAKSPDGRDAGTTASDVTGTYQLRVSGAGTYTIETELAAFARVTREATLTAESCSARVDFAMTLASRAAAVRPPSTPLAPGTPDTPTASRPSTTSSAARGFQNLTVIENATGVETSSASPEDEAARANLQLPPGFSQDAPTETLATTGNQGRLMNEPLLFGGGREGGPEGFGRGGDAAFGGQGIGEGGRGGFGGGPGGFAGGPGGFAGGPGFGGRGGAQRLQGMANYTLGGSVLDAAPYALNGRSVEKPEYVQQRYGESLGGPLKLHRAGTASARTSFFFSHNGNRSRNPVDSYSTVPSLAERSGDFSAANGVIVDPATGQPFPGNRIPETRIDGAARTLLPFIPLPNQDGSTQNFHYTTALTSSSDDVTFRMVHVFGAQPQGRGRGGPGGRGMPGAGPPGGGRGFGPLRPGARGGGRAGPARSTLNVSVDYRRSTAVQSSAFPTIGGTTKGRSWNVPVSYMYSKGRFNNMLNVTFNRNQTQSLNLYAFGRDIAGEAGISGVATDPFDWGVPNLSFTSVADLRDRAPSMRLDQRFEINDTVMRLWGRHAVRLGGGYRDLRLDSQSDTNARGSFVFTGLYTSRILNGRPVANTGIDFADFLLGAAQQASVNYGPGRVRLRGRTWNLYLQDDWRAAANLTVNAGVRYEYMSPYTETSGRLVNLDVAPDFSAAAAVVAGGTGPFTGAVRASLVEPDRNNIAPRVGLAWKPWGKTTIRTGYGVNYNLGAYGAIAQRLSAQPPFAVSATSIGTALSPLPLTDPFATIDSSTTTNSFGIDRRYQIGRAQIWNVDVQRELPHNLTVNVGYTGTKGSDLDLQRAPNRGPSGLRIEGVQPFIWQSSEGRSLLHTLNVRARKRLARGISFGGSYTWSRAYDDASSLGGAGNVVAQNDRDLAAEWGRSTFERRHTVNADYSVGLPFGRGLRWLNEGGLAADLFGDWNLSGNVTVQSGAPFTARVTGNVADVARGVNGTLRANYNGDPIALGDPTTTRFFNTAAFSVPPLGQFGNAGRNTITGPGSTNVNMALSKNVNFGRTRGMSIRIQATNVFNAVQFTSIDTVVNSPTFGQVTAVRPMRSVQLVTRVRF